MEDMISFQIPAMGRSYQMYVKFIKFCFQDTEILFYCYYKHEPMTCSFYLDRKNHDVIIKYLEQSTQSSPILIENINPVKYIASFCNTSDNIHYVIQMFRQLFSCCEMSVDIGLYNDYYFMDRCSFHLFDLYELGFMSFLPLVVNNHSIFNQYQPHIYTGIFLNALHPFSKYQYPDYIEMNMTSHVPVFLKLSLAMTLRDRPDLLPSLTVLIHQIMNVIPFKNSKQRYKNIKKNWKNNHTLKIYSCDLSTPMQDWKPTLFLKYMSRLLDIFPNYYIDPTFHMNISL